MEDYANIDATAWDILKVNEISYKLNSEDALKILVKHYDECGCYLDEHLSGSDIVKLIKERDIEHSFPPLKHVENIIEIARQIPDYIPEIPEYVWEKFKEPYITHGMGPRLTAYLLTLAPSSLHIVKKLHSLDQFSVCDWLYWLEQHPTAKDFIEKEVEREAEKYPTYEVAKAMIDIIRFEDVKSWDRLTPMDWVDLMHFNNDIFQKIMHERKILHKFTTNDWIEALECDETFVEEIPEEVWKELPDRVWEFLLKKKSKITKRNLKFR